MVRKHWFWLLCGLVVGLVISGRYRIFAQDRTDVPPANSSPAPRPKSRELPRDPVELDVSDQRPAMARAVKETANVITLREALLRPYKFPFARPTSLDQVCTHLRETLKGAVVLDLAALDRKSVEADDTVYVIEFEVCPGLPCFDFRAYCRSQWNLGLPDAMAETAARRLEIAVPA